VWPETPCSGTKLSVDHNRCFKWMQWLVAIELDLQPLLSRPTAQLQMHFKERQLYRGITRHCQRVSVGSRPPPGPLSHPSAPLPVQHVTLPCSTIPDPLPTLLQEFLAKCPAPKGSQETSLAKGILPATSYLSLPSKLPELKHKEGYQVLSPYYQMTLFDVMYASGRKDDRSISLLDRITLKGVCESSRAA